MRKTIIAALAIAIAPISGPQAQAVGTYCDFADEPKAIVQWQPSPAEWELAELEASTMSIAELAGASLVISYSGNAADLTSAEKAENLRRLGAKQLANAFLHQNYAGAILFTTNANSGKTAAAETEAFNYPKPWQFTAVDQEGGSVVRLSGDIAPPLSAAVIGQTRNPKIAKMNAFHSGNQLRAAGIDVVFAPVTDVRTTKTEPGLAARTYGASAESVSKMVVAQIRGYAQSGVMPALKHFPGLGGINADTHFAAGVYNGSLKNLCDTHIAPFKDAILAGAPMVMVGHANYKVFGDRPASANSMLLREILRNELGFEGIVITDSMTMAAASTNLGTGKNLFIRSLAAGTDLLLMPGNPSQAKAAIGKALANGNLDVAERRMSIARVIAHRLAFERIASSLPSFNPGSKKLKAAALNFQASVVK